MIETLLILSRAGCSESEIAFALLLDLPTLHLFADNLRDIIPPDVWSGA